MSDGCPSPWLARRIGPATVAAIAFVLFGLLGAATRSVVVLSVDEAVHDLIRATRSPALDRPMEIASRVGSGYVLLPVLLVASAFLANRHRTFALAATLAAGGTLLLEAVSKWLVGRPRPNRAPFGYPSGHVLGIVVFLGLLLLALHRFGVSRWRRRAATLAAVPIAVAVAYSRLYLNAHWLSDVLGGAAAGVAIVCGVLTALPEI